MTGARHFLSALAASLIAAAPALAQEQMLGSDGDHGPIQIQAASGIEWHQQGQYYVARGNAVAKRGNGEVHADTLTAYYRPAKPAANGAAAPAKPVAPAAATAAKPDKAGGNPDDMGGTEIYRIDADGHVVLNDPTRTIVGDKAVYDVDQAVVVVTGKGLKLTTPTDVVTARDSLEWYDQKRISVARGDAVAARADRRIRADVLTAYMTPNTASSPAPAKKPVQRVAAKPPAAKPGAAGAPAGEESEISRVDAQGHVLVSTSTDVGRSDFGVYNAKTGIVTLLGNVTLTRGRNVVRGQYAVMDLNTHLSRIMPAPHGGRVEGLLVRQEPAAAPAAAHAPR
jgi:lipopolysaccharide export system protein LptA